MSEDPIDIRIVSNLLLVFFLNSFLMTAYFKFTKFFLANLVFLRAIFVSTKIYCNDQVILKIFCKIFNFYYIF